MIKRIFGFISITVVLSLITGFLVVTYDIGGIVKSTFEKKASEFLKVDVNVREIKLDIFKGTFIASGVNINNPHGYTSPHFVEIRQLYTKFNPLSLFSENITINKVTIESPKMTIEFNLKNNNFSQIIKNLKVQTPEIPKHNKDKLYKAKADRKAVILEHLEIKNLYLHTLAGVVEANLTLNNIHLKNIGKDNNKLLFEQVLLIVLEQIYKDALKANIKSPSINFDKTLNNLRGSLKDSVKSTEGKLRSLLQ
ncbi:AsmA family protein [Holosporaceae bacterium 'Namur']|nr:AsmA family protein [Holosporaceae bacterium 'Namur']